MEMYCFRCRSIVPVRQMQTVMKTAFYKSYPAGICCGCHSQECDADLKPTGFSSTFGTPGSP